MSITIDEALAWECLLDLRARRRAGDTRQAVGLDSQGRMLADGAPVLSLHPAGWDCRLPLTPAARDLLDLYIPMLTAPQHRPFVVGHLGQSLDGRIATDNGVSQTISGPENLDHLHRLRAMADVVLVGAGTVQHDNPRLTTRRVPGDNPTRVVLDPDCRLASDCGLFTDHAAPTLVFCRESCRSRYTDVAVETLPCETDGRLSLPALLDNLVRRGLPVVFVEGGGVTVSAFLQAGLLDLLQITVAPMIIGAGRPGVSLPPPSDLEEALRPPVRTFTMGSDILFNCYLKAPAWVTGENG